MYSNRQAASKKERRPTLQNVADRVGVTKMTVSRYLNDPEQVSKTVQIKIAKALEEIAYIPSRAPNILSNAKSQAIGVLLPSLSNSVFAEVVKGIESITDPLGYQTMLAHYSYDPIQEEKRIASLLSYHVDGLILSENYHSERSYSMIKTANIPVIEIMDTPSNHFVQTVGYDNFSAAKAMTSIMISKGIQDIIYLGARLDRRTMLRQKGYEKAMLEAGLHPKNIQTDRPSTFILGGELLDLTLKMHPKTNGIFCTNDDIAIGAICECQRRGIAIPSQLAIAGFHGHDISRTIVPLLASVVTPRREIGVVAAQQLLNRINGSMDYPQSIDLGYSIQYGESL